VVAPLTAIAVLPFENMSVDPSQAYFARGLHDELLMQLSKVAGLNVTRWQPAIGDEVTDSARIKHVATALRVGSAVEASVQVVENRLRVNARLIDAKNDALLWGEHYDRTLDDAFAIQSDVARQIVAAVGAALTDAERRALAKVHTTDAEAYRLYLQGLEYRARRFASSPADLNIAEHFFEQAIALDSSFALAHIALAELHGLKYITRYDRSPARGVRQREEVKVALRLAPDLPEAHLAMASWLYQVEGDYQGALAELRIARDGLPNELEIWARIGQVTRRVGRWEESAAAHERTTQLDPRNAGLFKELGVTYMWMRRYSDAVAAYDRALSYAPDIVYPHLLKGLTYARWKGQFDTLRAVLRSGWSPTDEDGTAAALDLMYWDQKADSMLRISKTMPGAVFKGQNFFVPASLYAAWAHQLRSDGSAARKAFASALMFADSAMQGHSDDGRIHAARGLALAGLGRREEALREARWLQRSVPYRNDKFQGGVVVGKSGAYSCPSRRRRRRARRDRSTAREALASQRPDLETGSPLGADPRPPAIPGASCRIRRAITAGLLPRLCMVQRRTQRVEGPSEAPEGRQLDVAR
jgi:TolB-like protein/Flp pilus assembly protein TadD